jgi:DNA repair protein RadC
MEQAAKLIGVRLLDHVVVGTKSYRSLADMGLM